jgi:SAM-dependent methyltransferase
MDNYEYCARWAVRNGGRILDYGCGAGQIVRKLRERDIDGLGCDVFYAGNSERSFENLAEDVRPFISKMERGLIPFDDASFDAVITNQVLEHVPDLELSLREIARVLKPGGKVLALFPDKTIWREGHCGIPFLHWFPKGSTPRVYYAATLRALGAGYNKGDFPGVMHWARSFCDYLDKWTHYRSPAEVDATFSRHFRDTKRIELEWLQARLERLPLALIPAALRRFGARKLSCGRVMIAEK